MILKSCYSLRLGYVLRLDTDCCYVSSVLVAEYDGYVVSFWGHGSLCIVLNFNCFWILMTANVLGV